MWTAVLWLGACGGEPVLEGATPSVVLAGEPLRLVGRHLPDPLPLRLSSGDEHRSLIAVGGELRAPDTLPSGSWTLTADGVTGAATVLIEADQPCAGAFRGNTRVTLAKRLVVLDRYYPDGAHRTWSLPFDTLMAVELEQQPGCSAIFLRRSAGGRLLYDDDPRADLSGRAATLARWIGVPAP